MSDADRDNYEVGYGRPPRHSQFQPGRSGNPRGRPRGKPTPEEVLQRELGRHIKVQVGGSITSISKLEAVMRKLIQQAMEGDTGASRLIVQMMSKTVDGTASVDPSHVDPFGGQLPDDEAIERMVRRLNELYASEGESDE